MADEEWRDRLRIAFENSGKSKRSVSLASKNGPGYLHSILSEGKEPTVGNLIALCKQLDVSAAYILHGFEVTPAEEGLLKAIKENPSKSGAIFSLLSDK